MSARRLTRLALGIALLVAVLGTLAVRTLVVMPGETRGVRAEAPADVAELADELRRDVGVLAGEIGPRHAWRRAALDKAAQYCRSELEAAGWRVERHEFSVEGHAEPFCNLVAELAGSARAAEIVVVGAHYDSVATDDCPGANDNGSGVAAVLALARRFAAARTERTLRFVLFANEEPPFFLGAGMGSSEYARRCRERSERVVAMLSLETMGYFSDEPKSQRYPPGVSWFYPSTGNFIAFVSNIGSHGLLRRCVKSFRASAAIPAQGGALPSFLPGVGWSDHASFWKAGYPALMVTDTAPFRYPQYHTRGDTPDRLDYPRLALVVDGLCAVIAELASVRG